MTQLLVPIMFKKLWVDEAVDRNSTFKSILIPVMMHGASFQLTPELTMRISPYSITRYSFTASGYLIRDLTILSRDFAVKTK